ncbi:hypothetical protein BKA70DRAFT_1562805 [Coprinopsis sp. MPI-PUGE-AT-0042]|nr:hypothetical protein BKA70DRAFT_1562805 [Coprinopsis sp. MPI-PUGE-AT-0042]
MARQQLPGILLDQRLLEVPAKHQWHSEHKVSAEEVSSATENLPLRCAALESVDILQKELDEYRQRLDKAINLYKGILCPVHRLPDEILREIFLQYCDNGTAIHLSPKSDTLCTEHDPVHVLERVCSRWTRVSRSTVQLWAYLDYHLTPGEVKEWTRFMALSDRLLARSQNAPLFISFHPEELDFSPSATAAHVLNAHIFDRLVGSTGRWKALTANARCIALLQQIGIIPNMLSNVTFVDLEYSFDKSRPDSEVYPQPLELPSATALTLTNTVEQTDPPSENYDFLNAPNITCVNIAEYRDSRLLLPRLTTYHLETLTLTLRDLPYVFLATEEYAPPLGDLAFPRLKTLNMQTRDGEWGVAIPWALRGLTCPSLSSLAICATTGERGTNAIIKPLSDFLSRSGCRLDNLTLSKLPAIDISGILSILALQSISELSVRLHSVWIEGVNTLITHLTSIPSGYRLSRLWILVHFQSGTPPDELNRPFSLARLEDLRNANMWQSGSRNAEIRIEVPCTFEADIRERLVAICDSSRRSPVRVSFADDRTFWQHHLIDDLEGDLWDDISEDESDL